MKTIRILLSLCLIFLLFLSTAMAVESSVAKIVVIDTLFDFGSVPFDFQLVHSFKITNDGSSNLVIDKLLPNCDCTIAISKDSLILPGDTSTIKIHFNTNDYYGPNTRHVTIHSNDPDLPATVVEYASNIGYFPKLYRVSPISLFFLPGHQEKETQFHNNSNERIEFTIEMERNCYFDIDMTKGNIMPKKSSIIKITPTSNIPKGTHQSNFTVVFDTKPEVRITVPVKIARF